MEHLIVNTKCSAIQCELSEYRWSDKKITEASRIAHEIDTILSSLNRKAFSDQDLRAIEESLEHACVAIYAKNIELAYKSLERVKTLTRVGF
jgi:hypothetical protein